MLNGFSGRVRRVVLNGRRYVVAPVTMLVSGVLAGSRGPLYYAQNEVSKSTDKWNGMPIVYGHPISNNSHVSARTPEIAGSLELGRVYNSRTENGRLTAEAWFDEDACNRVDSRIIQNLDAGRRMEVSTGLFTETRPAPPNAAHGGKAYSYTTHDYQPDHLALLIDQEGACSLRDGCGVLNASLERWVPIENCGGKGSGIPGPCPKGAGIKAGDSHAKIKAKIAALKGKSPAVKAGKKVEKTVAVEKVSKAKDTAAKVGKSLKDLESSWVSKAQRDNSTIGKSAMASKIKETLGKASAHQVMKELGMPVKAKNADEAVNLIIDKVTSRIGSILRSRV